MGKKFKGDPTPKVPSREFRYGLQRTRKKQYFLLNQATRPYSANCCAYWGARTSRSLVDRRKFRLPVTGD